MPDNSGYNSLGGLSEADFLASLAGQPSSPAASTTTMANPLAVRNAGMPSNLQYTPTTYTLNPNYDPSAVYTPPSGGAEFDPNYDPFNAQYNWLREHQQYQPNSWMINTAPTGYGAVGMQLQSGTPYVLRNNETGETLAQGSDDATLQRIADLISGGSLGDKWQLFEPGQSAYGNLSAGLSPQDAAFVGNTGYGNSEYVEGTDGQPGYWLNPVAGARPAPSTLSQFANAALHTWGIPIAAAYLGPAIQSVNALGHTATTLGAGLAGAAAGAAPGVISGASIGDILKGAAIGGLSSVGLQQLGNLVGPSTMTPGSGTTAGSGNSASSTGVSGNGTTAGVAAPGGEIVVTGGAPAAVGGLGSIGAGIAPIVAGIGQQVGAQAAEQARQQDPTAATDNSEIVVSAARGLQSAANMLYAGATPGMLAGYGYTPQQIAAAQEYVSRNAEAPASDGEIVVSGSPTTTTPVVSNVFSSAQPQGLADAAEATGLSPQEVLDAENSTATSGSSTLGRIGDYLRIAGLGTGLLGSLAGGGGSSASATVPRGLLGATNPTYSATLPTPGQNGGFAVGGLGGGGAGTTGTGGFGAAPAGGDYTHFGMGNAVGGAGSPGYAADIPQYGGVNPPGFNSQTWEWLGPQHTSPPQLDLAALPRRASAPDFAALPPSVAQPVAMPQETAAPIAQPFAAKPNVDVYPDLPTEKKMAHGGYAVGGPGDGRADEIPAMLSDGEYVIDAETVALLGNGSNKAGAQQLDKFRANIRKHKGRELARGDFSVKAKRPEAYLSGGRP